MWYVYIHIDPATSQIVYVGKGTKERVFSETKRKPAHIAFMRACWEAKTPPDKWAQVIFMSKDEQEILDFEAGIIREFKPAFNLMMVSAANAGRGLDNHNAKLTPEQVIEMRKEYANGGISMRSIGRKYGVCYSTARGVLLNNRWKHIGKTEGF